MSYSYEKNKCFTLDRGYLPSFWMRDQSFGDMHRNSARAQRLLTAAFVGICRFTYYSFKKIYEEKAREKGRGRRDVTEGYKALVEFSH